MSAEELPAINGNGNGSSILSRGEAAVSAMAEISYLGRTAVVKPSSAEQLLAHGQDIVEAAYEDRDHMGG